MQDDGAEATVVLGRPPSLDDLLAAGLGGPWPDEATLPGGPPQPAPPLRGRVLAAADRGDSDLDAFLAEPRLAQQLAAWFGPALPRDRRRLLALLDRDIAAIDQALREQVDAILQAPRLQRLEASWRGLIWLIGRADEADRVKLKVLTATWAEVCRDLERAIEFDQSAMFEKIHNEGFGIAGGEPFGVLLCDYAVQHRRTPDHPTDDVTALAAFAQVAAAAFAPAIFGCTPRLLGLDDFDDLALGVNLASTFQEQEYLRWRRLQESEDARFIGVVLPRVLARLPYGDAGAGRIDGFRFREARAVPDAADFLWGNAVYAFGSVLIRAFQQYSWFADIRGAQRDQVGGGLVDGLPVAAFPTDRPGVALRFSTEVAISDRQEQDLSDLGFIPLSRAKDTPYCVFYSNASLQRPRNYDRSIAAANAKLSSMLQYVMCVARFAHFIKVMGRDRIGMFATAEDCETFFARWLQNYLLGNDDASPEQKARYPLREGNVQVRDLPGKPGHYAMTIHLRPHFQLDQVVSAFKLVTELNPGAAA
ncbi:MAG: type VI secretion system contractile sheath large subunit [Thalassobaculales bacterium]